MDVKKLTLARGSQALANNGHEKAQEFTKREENGTAIFARLFAAIPFHGKAGIPTAKTSMPNSLDIGYSFESGHGSFGLQAFSLRHPWRREFILVNWRRGGARWHIGMKHIEFRRETEREKMLGSGEGVQV
jgi:hypothetical protein